MLKIEASESPHSAIQSYQTILLSTQNKEIYTMSSKYSTNVLKKIDGN